MAAIETSCYKDPILVYGPGAFINMYQVIINHPLQVDFKAISSHSYEVIDGEIRYNSLSTWQYFKPVNPGKK